MNSNNLYDTKYIKGIDGIAWDASNQMNSNNLYDTKYMMEFKGLPGIAWDESNLMNCKKLSDKLYDTKDIIDTKGLMELLEMQVIWWICLINSYKTLWYKVYHGVLRIAGIVRVYLRCK